MPLKLIPLSDGSISLENDGISVMKFNANGDITTRAADTTLIRRKVYNAVDLSVNTSGYTFTGIPTWAKRLRVTLQNVGWSSPAAPRIQIGAASLLTTGYDNYFGYSTSGATANAGAGDLTSFQGVSANSGDKLFGTFNIDLVPQTTGNLWMMTGMYHANTYMVSMSGSKDTIDPLTQLRFFSSNAYNSGFVSLVVEG